MALIYNISTKAYSLAIWKVSESTEELSKELYSPSILQKILNEVRTEKRRKERITAHIILKELLGEEKEIKHDANNAPYIENSNLHISISHTNNLVAVAISNNPIGIDIEDRERKQLQLSHKFTTEQEKKWIDSCKTIEEKQLTAEVIWSAKEAIYKLANIKGLLFESEIEITPFIPQSESNFKASYLDKNTTNHLLLMDRVLLVVSC